MPQITKPFAVWLPPDDIITVNLVGSHLLWMRWIQHIKKHKRSFLSVSLAIIDVAFSSYEKECNYLNYITYKI